MGVTLVVACWFAAYAVSPNIGWLFIGGAVMLGLTWMIRQSRVLFFLPLVVCTNWMLLLKCSPTWTTPSFAIMIGGGIAVAAIAISEFTIARTRNKFRNSAVRTGVIFAAIRSSAVAGICVGLQIGAPVFIAGLTTWLTPFPTSLHSLAWMAILSPVLSCLIFGVILGVVLGFVCDVIVAADFRNRPTSKTESALGNAG